MRTNLLRWLCITVAAGIFATLAGCGLPKPTHKTGARIPIDNRPDCAVFGVWEHYTWSGECRGGLTDGQGTLLGYAGSTLMLRYEGGMKAGLRDGVGEMWINADKINGGPTTRSGRFVRGNLDTGTETDGYSVRTYANGENSNTTYKSSGDESSGIGSMTASLLGAAVQGIAAGGGRNAAGLGAVGSALTSANGYGNATPNVSGYASSRSTTGTSQSKAATCNLSSPSQFQCQCGQEQGQWLGLTKSGTIDGGIRYSEYQCKYSSAFTRTCTYAQDSRFNGCTNPAIR